VVAGRWWTSVPPGLFLLGSVLGFSLLGEGLQERADAEMRHVGVGRGVGEALP
jgi:peptide/nickel transport system permease protein